MAKIYGLNGLIRGRQGNNVFSVQNGTQVLKVYNPAVSNPRSLGQREQRTKFSLAGKISSATPWEALQGLGAGNKRGNRAKFVQQIVRNAIVSGSADNLTATIAYGDVVYSLGSLATYSSGSTFTAIWEGDEPRSRVRVTVNPASFAAEAPQGYGELVVMAVYDAATSSLDEVQVARRAASQTIVFSFRLRLRSNLHVAMYLVPFAERSSLSAPVSGNLADGESDVSLSAVSASTIGEADFGRSVFVNAIPVLGAQQSIAPNPSDDTRFETDADTGDVKRAVKKK